MTFEIPFTEIDTILFGALASALAVAVVIKILKNEFRSKKCVFCGNFIAADEHAHHLEVCGLRNLLAISGKSSGSSQISHFR